MISLRTLKEVLLFNAGNSIVIEPLYSLCPFSG